MRCPKCGRNTGTRDLEDTINVCLSCGHMWGNRATAGFGIQCVRCNKGPCYDGMKRC